MGQGNGNGNGNVGNGNSNGNSGNNNGNNNAGDRNGNGNTGSGQGNGNLGSDRGNGPAYRHWNDGYRLGQGHGHGRDAPRASEWPWWLEDLTMKHQAPPKARRMLDDDGPIGIVP
ncbi:hypothetical protein [Aureimonas sp. AU4]|uniref:hypothetical protein n=1 Tax=Aureimonas sp. AU4 TaxID=1638163 RepID=UPI000A9CC2A4|nr:hypothetical protein [Aureimonas sp. AU4]